MSNLPLIVRTDPGTTNSSGFTLIELMIVVSIIAIILTLALPVYSNYTIRAKIGEAISIATAAKTAVAASCIEDPTITAITPENMGYEFSGPTQYVASIILSGDCTQPLITVQTQLTGAVPDPTILLVGRMASGAMQFTCSTSGSNMHVPEECRS